MKLSTWRSAAVVFGFTLFSSVAPAVRADLAPPFAGKVIVDTQYVSGASGATDIAFAADGRALVTQKSGQIVIRRVNGTQVVLNYPFPESLDTASEKGLLGVVADPNVAQNNTFYFYVSNGPTNDKHRVYRAQLTAADTLVVNPTPIVGASRNLGPGLEGPANHDGGGMFIANNQLYIGVGDTGSNASPPVNKYGSCLNKGNGKILRVNLDGSIPSDNPLVSLNSVTACTSPISAWTTAAPDPRIFAWGLRNPWRFWIDSVTGLLWIADVGEDTQEGVSISTGNQHYGWPFVEGNQVWGDIDGKNCASETPSRVCRAPAFTYTHAEGFAITGGLIPQGCGWSNVFGGTRYLYADSSSSWIRALTVNSSRTGFSSSTPAEFATYANAAPVSLRMGPDQALYVVFNNPGGVYRFAPSVRTGADCGAAAAVPASSPQSTWLLLVLLVSLGAWLATQHKVSDRKRSV